MLLLHQTPRSWDEYRDVIPILARRRRVIAMDTIGFGDSTRLPPGERLGRALGGGGGEPARRARHRARGSRRSPHGRLRRGRDRRRTPGTGDGGRAVVGRGADPGRAARPGERPSGGRRRPAIGRRGPPGRALAPPGTVLPARRGPARALHRRLSQGRRPRRGGPPDRRPLRGRGALSAPALPGPASSVRRTTPTRTRGSTRSTRRFPMHRSP